MAYGDFKYLARRTASDKVNEIKHLPLLKILNIMRIKGDFLIKSQKGVMLLMIRLNKIYNYVKNYTNKLLENLEKEQFIQDLKIIF